MERFDARESLYTSWTRNEELVIKKVCDIVEIYDGNSNLLFTLNELESIVCSIMHEHELSGQRHISHEMLGVYTAIRLGLFDDALLQKRINDVCLEVENMTYERAHSTDDEREVAPLAYFLSGCSGHISDYSRKLIQQNTGCKVLKEHVDNFHSFLDEKVRVPLEGLISKGIFTKRVIPDIGEEMEKANDFLITDKIMTQSHFIGDLIFLPKKMLLVKPFTPLDTKSILQTFLSSIDVNFPDVVGNEKNIFETLHEKYPDDTLDFGLVTPTMGGICITEDCQMKCVYCTFSSGEQRGKTLRMESVESFVNMLAMNAVKQRLTTKTECMLKIDIAGGGEPTYKWDEFVATVGYIKTKTEMHKIQCWLRLTTNGCLSPAQTEYIANNFDAITISFDGLPELQNKNRPFANGKPSFDIIDRTIRQLDALCSNYNFTTVIQPENFSKLEEMEAFIFKNYPNVKGWNARPVIATGRGESSAFYGDHPSFVKEYLDMVSKSQNSERIFGGIIPTKTVSMFCGAIYGMHPWLLPNNTLVTCMDANKNAVIMGDVVDGKIVLKKAKDIYATKAFEYMKECSDCFIYDLCCGDCPLKNNTPEMTAYSNWACEERQEYWRLLLSNLELNGSCDGWHLHQLPFNNMPGAEVYEIRRD